MQALLMLYMTEDLLKSRDADRVIGLHGFRHVLELAFGPMTSIGFASETYGLYAGLIYVTPLAGAWLADRLLGKTRMVCIRALLMSAGHLAMAATPLFLIALGLLIVGGGCVIGNLSSQVGDLYSHSDGRRTRAFAVFLLASSVRSLLAPLVSGPLGERAEWHYGFGAAGIGMMVGADTAVDHRVVGWDMPITS